MENQIQLQLQLYQFFIINYNYVIGPSPAWPQTSLAGLNTHPPASSWYNHCLRHLIRAGCGNLFLGHVGPTWSLILLLRQQKLEFHYFYNLPLGQKLDPRLAVMESGTRFTN